jgi:hypothetical protein
LPFESHAFVADVATHTFEIAAVTGDGFGAGRENGGRWNHQDERLREANSTDQRVFEKGHCQNQKFF